MILRIDNGVISKDSIQLKKGENVICVAASDPLDQFAIGFNNVVEIINRANKVLKRFFVEGPTDIHLVREQLLIKGEKGIWLADSQSGDLK